MNTSNTSLETPGALIGTRNNGRPIYLIAGGAPDDDGNATNGDGQNGADGANNDGGAGDKPNSDNNQQKTSQDADTAATIARLEKDLTAARAEAGKARTTAKQQAADEAVKQVIDKIGSALGLKENEKADPEKLAKEITEARSETRDAKVQLAVYRGAGKHQADADALLDSRKFLTSLADLDPAGKDFDSKVADAIKQAVADNQKLKTGQAPGSSSVDHAGGSGEQRNRTPRPLTDAVSGHYGTT